MIARARRPTTTSLGRCLSAVEPRARPCTVPGIGRCLRNGQAATPTSTSGVGRSRGGLAAACPGRSKNRRQDDVLIGGGWMAPKSRCDRGLRERGLPVSTMTNEDSPSNLFLLLGLWKKSFWDTNLPSLSGFACPSRSFGSGADRGEPRGQPHAELVIRSPSTASPSARV